MKKIILILAVSTCGLIGLSGCNTIEGFGEDVEQTGKTIQKI